MSLSPVIHDAIVGFLNRAGFAAEQVGTAAERIGNAATKVSEEVATPDAGDDRVLAELDYAAGELGRVSILLGVLHDAIEGDADDEGDPRPHIRRAAVCAAHRADAIATLFDAVGYVPGSATEPGGEIPDVYNRTPIRLDTLVRQRADLDQDWSSMRVEVGTMEPDELRRIFDAVREERWDDLGDIAQDFVSRVVLLAIHEAYAQHAATGGTTNE